MSPCEFQNQGAKGHAGAKPANRRNELRPRPGPHNALFSPIRTVTVGSGIAPDLLTLPKQALAGSSAEAEIPPVGNFTLP